MELPYCSRTWTYFQVVTCYRMQGGMEILDQHLNNNVIIQTIIKFSYIQANLLLYMQPNCYQNVK